MSAPTQEEINRIISGMNEANYAADFADTVVFEPQQMEGTRYKYILTNEQAE